MFPQDERIDTEIEGADTERLQKLQAVITALAMHRGAEGNLDERTALLRVVCECVENEDPMCPACRSGIRPLTVEEAGGKGLAMLTALPENLWPDGDQWLPILYHDIDPEEGLVGWRLEIGPAANHIKGPICDTPLDALLEAMLLAFGVEVPA